MRALVLTALFPLTHAASLCDCASVEAKLAESEERHHQRFAALEAELVAIRSAIAATPRAQRRLTVVPPPDNSETAAIRFPFGTAAANNITASADGLHFGIDESFHASLTAAGLQASALSVGGNLHVGNDAPYPQIHLGGQSVARVENGIIELGDIVGGDGSSPTILRANDEPLVYLRSGNVGVGVDPESDASKLTVAGSLSATSVSLSGNLDAQAATLSGALSANKAIVSEIETPGNSGTVTIQWSASYDAPGGGKTYDLGSISNWGTGTRAVATFEFVNIYGYAYSYISGGMMIATCRRVTNNAAWRGEQTTVHTHGDGSYVPARFSWADGSLQLQLDSWEGAMGVVRVTTRGGSFVPSGEAGR